MKITARSAAFLLTALAIAVFSSCQTTPPSKEPISAEKPLDAKVEEKAPEVKVEAEEERTEIAVEELKTETPPPAAEVPFDPKSITKEVFDSTKSDVQALIERLNAIIRDKDYETWVTFLGPTYRAALSDTSFLGRISASTVLRKQKIVLRELRDYFIYVVVPSRANDRVDDIEFIGQNRVKAFTVDSKGRRLRLYDLEKTPTGWEIIN